MYLVKGRSNFKCLYAALIGRKIIEEVPKYSSLQDFNTLNASKSKKPGSDRIKGDSFENEVQLMKPEVSKIILHVFNHIFKILCVFV